MSTTISPTFPAPTILDALAHRRAVKSFVPVDIPAPTREQLLHAARLAPSSFNMQPYRLFWIESPAHRAAVAKLCLNQTPAQTASALVVAVADLASLRSTAELQLDWMRQSGFPESKLRDYARTAKIGRILFAPGPFNLFAALKWTLLRILNLCKPMGMPPLSRQSVFNWATKGTALACQNLMIAAEALGLNTCPMEGFDNLRLARYLGLSRKHHQIVMVIAIGKQAPDCVPQPQWRRPLSSTVTIL
jgi:nitroreductase